MWRGGLGAAYLLPALSSAGASIASPCFRFHIPLIEPDGPVSGIRLSEKGSRCCPRETARPLGKADKAQHFVQGFLRKPLGPRPQHFVLGTQPLTDTTFQFFANVVGWEKQSEPIEEPAPTWADLLREYSAQFQRKILQGDRSEATWRRYDLTCETFTEFLRLRRISRLQDISRRLVEDFKAHRLEAILKRKYSRGGSGLHLDVAILHCVFAFAIDVELLTGKNNPVKFEKYRGKKPKGGAQPFTHEELTRLRQSANQDLLAFLLLRYTGLRGFDATDIRWSEIDFRERMLSRLTHKREK
jgi:hypothetical protein